MSAFLLSTDIVSITAYVRKVPTTNVDKMSSRWLEVEWNRCKTRASLPLAEIRRPRGDTPIWKPEAALKCRSCRKGRYAPPVHLIKLDRDARDHALRLGASGRGEVSPPVQTGRAFVVLGRI